MPVPVQYIAVALSSPSRLTYKDSYTVLRLLEGIKDLSERHLWMLWVYKVLVSRPASIRLV